MVDLEAQEEEVEILLYSPLLISNSGKQSVYTITSNVSHIIIASSD